MDQTSAQDDLPLTEARSTPKGGVHFVPALERDALCRELDGAGYLVVVIDALGPVLRGRLGAAIDEAIEKALRERGAAAPFVPATGKNAALRDQLHRARRSGAIGIALVIGPLRAYAGSTGAIEPEDSATLSFLAGAARERAIVLLLDGRDGTTLAYTDPVPLGHLMAPTWVRPNDAALIQGDEPETTERPPNGADREADRMATPPASAADSSLALDSPAERPPATAAGAFFASREEPWRAWTLQLTAARGPQPLGALERIFAESYVPLANALAAGLDDPRARAAHDEFRRTFVRSYTEASATFAATTKRPRMVLDVHEVAGRTARLHGARSTRLLLVDSMRWDISRLVEEKLSSRLGSRAVLTDDLIMWSALPTTTMRQLETIARGVEALRSPGELDADPQPPRGRTAEYIRRLRVGPRELHKLDVVETRVSTSRGHVLEALPEIAEATAEVIARYTETLAPHTLLFVFGDHGFTIDRSGSAQQGGASPEEVLVGAFALLVGDVH